MVFYSFNTDHPYTYSYAYDDMVSGRQIYAQNTNTISAANVFTAFYDDETLEAVSFFPRGRQTDYEIRIYTGVTDLPDSGTLRQTVTGTAIEEGYRTVPLTEAIPLKQGEKYAVVVSLRTRNQLTAVVCDSTEDWGKGKVTKVREAGESFINKGNGWEDLIHNDKAGNVRVRAFTNSPSAKPYADTDDYHSYNGKTRTALLSELEAVTTTTKKYVDQTYFNHVFIDSQEAYMMLNLNNSVLNDPLLFTAAEMQDYINQVNDFVYHKIRLIDHTVAYDEEGEWEYTVEHMLPNTPFLSDLPVYKKFLKACDDFDTNARQALYRTAEIYYNALVKIQRAYYNIWRTLYATGWNGTKLQAYGDVNNDGRVDINDATCLQKILAELAQDDYYSDLNADVNNDYRKDINDVTEIQRFLAEFTAHFPVYDETFAIRDGYTAESGREALTAYMGAALAQRASRDTFDEDYLPYSQYRPLAIYRAVKTVYAHAADHSPAMLLFYTRLLINDVPPDETNGD